MYSRESTIKMVFLSFLSILFTSVMSSETNRCGQDSIEEAIGCTASLGFFSQEPTQLIDDSSTQRMVDGCRSGKFLDAVNCIERVMADCQNDTSDIAVALRSNIDIQKMRQTIVYFCNNLNEYVSDATCVKRQLNQISNCSHDVRVKFSSQHSRPDPDQDELIKTHCAFFFKVVSCMVSTVRKNCNGGTADIISTVMKGFEPPVCTNSSSYDILAGNEGNVEGSEGGLSITVTDNDNLASSIPCISFHFALVIFLWQHLMKAIIS